MGISLTPVTVGTQHFSDLYALANAIVGVLANQVVTANGSAGWGSTTTGNGFVFGVFGANTIVAPLLQGGNVATPNTCYLMSNLNVNTNVLISGVTSINATAIAVGANLTVTPTSVFLGNTTANVTVNSTSFVLQTATANSVINATGFFYNSVPVSLGFVVNTTTTGTSSQSCGTCGCSPSIVQQNTFCKSVIITPTTMK